MSALQQTVLCAMAANSVEQAIEVLELGEHDLAITHLREAIEQVELMKLTTEGGPQEPKQITLDV